MKSVELLSEMMGDKNIIHFQKMESDGNLIEVELSVNGACTEASLQKAESDLAFKLPNEYRSFLRVFDGSRLFDYDKLDGIQLLSTDELCKFNLYARNTFEEIWDEDILIFAKYIGEDNYLGFHFDQNGNYNIIDCFFEEIPNNWKVIANSFDEFLMKFLLEQGRKYWL